jgi:hypothetical protein
MGVTGGTFGQRLCCEEFSGGVAELYEGLSFQVRTLDSAAVASAFLLAEGGFMKFAVVERVTDSGHTSPCRWAQAQAVIPSPWSG